MSIGELLGPELATLATQNCGHIRKVWSCGAGPRQEERARRQFLGEAVLYILCKHSGNFARIADPPCDGDDVHNKKTKGNKKKSEDHGDISG